MSAKINPRLKQQELIEYAVAIGDYYGTKLDFTEKSLKKVDTILDKVCKQYKPDANSTDQTKEEMYGIALNMGAYIIAVMERANGEGTWERDDPEAGEESWPFTYGSVTVFPVEWCLKRIYDKNASSVAYKYKNVFLDAIH